MGKIELDHTGTGGGITLSSDGTDLLLDGTAIGGGGGTALELYAENPSSPTAPVATGINATAIGTNASATGNWSLAFGRNSSATQNYTLALGLNSDADGSSSTSIGLNTTAGSLYSTALGVSGGGLGSVTATGGGAMALGGSYASGADSFAAAIANNTSSYGATGANSVAIGYLAKATASGAVSFGDTNLASGEDAAVFGQGNTGSGPFSFTAGLNNNNSGSRGIALGNGNTVSSFYSAAIGTSNIASGGSVAIALGNKANADKEGKLAFASGAGWQVGESQYGLVVLSKNTTDATPVALTRSGSSLVSPSATNQIILPNNSAYAFHGTIVARQQASQGTACAAWKVEGLIRREGSAGTTVLVNSATTVLDNTPAWGMALSADTTNGGLKIEVTGAAATNIRWVATINTSEVTY